MGSRKKLTILVLIVTVVIFVMMAVSFVARSSSAPGHIVGTVVRPVQQFFSGIGHGVSGFFRFFGDMKDYQTENLELKDNVAKLEEQVRSLESYKQENERLRQLLELKSREAERDTVGCEVIAKDPGNWFYTFTIDKGSEADISVNDTVIAAQGLVGRVTEVGLGWSKVLSIIDVESSVGALVSRTQDFAIVDGELSMADKGLCKLSYVTTGAHLVVGDAVVTSGLGGVYPEGILIGTVSEIQNDSMGYSRYALVDTAVDFERIREVMVIRSHGSHS